MYIYIERERVIFVIFVSGSMKPVVKPDNAIHGVLTGTAA